METGCIGGGIGLAELHSADASQVAVDETIIAGPHVAAASAILGRIASPEEVE